MFGIDNYSVFVLSAVALNLIPGADTMYILGSSISNGRNAGILSALGISSGCIVHTVMAGLGLSVILSQSALAFNLIKYIGASYLVYLGIRSFLSKSSLPLKTDQKINHRSKKIYLQAVMTNVLNPKVALFFLAFLPQFIDPANPYGALPFLLLGLTFVFTGTIWGIILALGTAYFAGRLNGSAASRWLNKVTGIIFMALGLNLLRAKLTS